MGAPARAQRPDTPVVGCLGSEAPDSYASHLVAFRDGLAEAGYAEGRNVAIESRWAGGQYRRLPALAEDLVGRRLSVIVALGGAEMAPAAKAATAATPSPSAWWTACRDRGATSRACRA